MALGARFRPGFGGYFFIVHGGATILAGSTGGEVDDGGAAKIGTVAAIEVIAGPAGAEVLLVETRLR